MVVHGMPQAVYHQCIKSALLLEVAVLQALPLSVVILLYKDQRVKESCAVPSTAQAALHKSGLFSDT